MWRHWSASRRRPKHSLCVFCSCVCSAGAQCRERGMDVLFANEFLLSWECRGLFHRCVWKCQLCSVSVAFEVCVEHRPRMQQVTRAIRPRQTHCRSLSNSLSVSEQLIVGQKHQRLHCNSGRCSAGRQRNFLSTVRDEMQPSPHTRSTHPHAAFRILLLLRFNVCSCYCCIFFCCSPPCSVCVDC